MAESSQAKYGRRDVLRLGAGVGAAGAVGSAGMSQNAVALPEPLNPTAAPALAYEGVRYLYDGAADILTGSEFDDEAYEESEQQEVYAGIEESGLDMMANNDSVLTAVQNTLANSVEIAYSDARYEMIEAMNLGNSESEVRDRGESEVNEFFAVQQENILNHFDLQINRFDRMFNSVEEAGLENSSGELVLYPYNSTFDDGDGSRFGSDWTGLKTLDYDLVNGENYTYSGFDIGGTYDISSDEVSLRLDPLESGSTTTILDFVPFADIMERIEDLHSDTIDEVNEFVDGTFEDYESGDISLSGVVRGSDLVRMSSDEEENPVAGADLAMMGLEANTDSQMTIELLDRGETVDGSVYMQNSPDDGLEVGRTYSAGDFDGIVYIAYQTSDGSETAEIQGDFAVMDAIDADGESLDSVEYSDRTGQERTTFDSEELNAELKELNDLQIELREQQQRIAEQGGGGLDFGFDGIGNTGLLVGGAAVVLALLGSGGS